MILQFNPIDAMWEPITMRSSEGARSGKGARRGKEAAKEIGTTTKEYSAAAIIFFLGNKETE